MKILTRKGQRPSTDTVKKYAETSSNGGMLASFPGLPREIPVVLDRIPEVVRRGTPCPFRRPLDRLLQGCIDSRQPAARCCVLQNQVSPRCCELRSDCPFECSRMPEIRLGTLPAVPADRCSRKTSARTCSARGRHLFHQVALFSCAVFPERCFRNACV